MGYNIIRKLFFWRKKEEPPKTEEEPEFMVSVMVGCNKNGDLDVKCEWLEETDEASAFLAEILFYLESGFLGPYLQNILIQHTAENPETTDFVISTVAMLGAMMQGSSDRPLVKPSHVFGTQMEAGHE